MEASNERGQVRRRPDRPEEGGLSRPELLRNLCTWTISCRTRKGKVAKDDLFVEEWRPDRLSPQTNRQPAAASSARGQRRAGLTRQS